MEKLPSTRSGRNPIKRSDFVPGVQFQILRPDLERMMAVYTFDLIDPHSKYPVEILTFRGESINVTLFEDGLQIYHSFGGMMLRSEVIPFSRIIPVTNPVKI
jgi:hypothetical protein